MLPALVPPQNVGEDAANALFRWIHILAGVLWIGHLYFFNFVNAELAKTYDADSKRKVIPELMPRALYWFRMGALITWITGVLMLAILYWHQDNFGAGGPKGALVAFLIIVVAFAIYDVIAKALQKQAMLALWIWYAIVFAFALGLTMCEFFGASPRGAYIHTGAMLGTAMAANVWMRIWPCQKRIITAIKAGTAPDPAAPRCRAALKHNTYMSVPWSSRCSRALTSVRNDYGWAILIVIVIVGWGAVKLLYEIGRPRSRPVLGR
jgi:uncharacterized membrane protein